MPAPRTPVYTIHYQLYLLETLVEALRTVFATHPDPYLAQTKVRLDWSSEQSAYPAIVVRYFERDIPNAGVAHIEYFEDPNNIGEYIPYRHRLYHGDAEFAIYALSTLERAKISDALVQILTMADTEVYTNAFLNRIYAPDPTVEPASIDHFVNLNTDDIRPFGQTQVPVPWQAEDDLLYQTAYRVPVMGEFYSRTPSNGGFGLVERIDQFPYNEVAGETEPNPPNPGPDGTYGTGDDIPDNGPWEG